MTGTSPISRIAAASGASGAKDGSSAPDLPAIKEAVLTTLPPPEEAAQSTDQPLKPPEATADRRLSVSLAEQPTQQQPVQLIKEKNGQWALAPDSRLVNNLSWVVGFMELANAGDFAANIWNDIPVPVYAVVFMAIGGTVAGFLSIFAFRDARRAWNNVRYLRKQRRLLLEEKSSCESRSTSTLELDVILAINFRELGTELVTRWIMALLMGFGAILISIGTYMAIGGANQAVFFASNLLSGYVGNAPIALFGLVNSSWAAFIFCKAHGHVVASRTCLGSCTAAALVKRRARKVQVFCVINGTATVLGGVASMVTATRWWGYVVLIPVIIASIFCNIWWRKMMGYTRSEGHPAMARADLVHALQFAAAAEFSNLDDPEAVPPWCSEMPATLGDTLDFLAQHSLFHQYCLEAVANTDIRQALGGNLTDAIDLTISPHDIFVLPSALHPTLMGIAKKVVRDVRPSHFRNRERYLSELLGTYCTMARQHGIDDDAGSTGSHEEVGTEKI
ncbi:hypothetical protein QQS21_006826 [Conoideocrella luteorostrata]|uniref:Integral membrane protein n=1 Tax=Conoideocrella luteorostrata TaxID=1105319 RepID=A0AAJ0CLY1_9HYPO|nr:hypothetical protein QQS21_006826 [Conoideocrella luteorostrata]